MTDITERRAADDRLQHLADHDALTDLFNRRRFVEELELEIAATRRGMRSSAVMVIDIDGFKFVNDSAGHQAGDELIRAVARTARRSAARQRRDRAARRRRVRRACCAERAARRPTPSRRSCWRRARAARCRSARDRADDRQRGIAAWGRAARRPSTTSWRHADMAMYEAKDAGRDRVVRFTDDCSTELGRGRSWVARLRDGARAGRLRAARQPIVAPGPARWRCGSCCCACATRTASCPAGRVHRRRRALRPDRGDRPLGAAPRARRSSVEPGARGLGASRSTSRASRSATRLSGPRAACWSEAGIDPSGLIVEITETAAIANIERRARVRRAAARLGCKVALDDFGAGSRLLLLAEHLPLNYLKIDGEFIEGSPRSPIDQEIVAVDGRLARGIGRRRSPSSSSAETSSCSREKGVDLAGLPPRPPAPAGGTAVKQGSLLVTDAPHLLYRGFFALPDSIKGADGQPVNALLGSVNQTLWCVEQYKPARRGDVLRAGGGRLPRRGVPRLPRRAPEMPDTLAGSGRARPRSTRRSAGTS